MERIFPIDEASVRGYLGRPVYAVLNDGSRFCGYLSDCRDGCVILTSGAQGAANVSSRTSKRKAKPAGKAATKSWGYPGYYGAGWSVALPLFLLALLFALPFGFYW